jgi:hypothetical protein
MGNYSYFDNQEGCELDWNKLKKIKSGEFRGL